MRTVNALAIKGDLEDDLEDDFLLLVRKDYGWTLPGGTPNAGESDDDCLKRVFGVELPHISIPIGNLLGGLHGVGSDRVVYTARVDGHVGKIGESIADAAFVKKTDIDSYQICSFVSKMIQAARRNGRLR